MPQLRQMNITSSILEDKSTAAYLGLAIGDALGATLEFLTEQEIKQRYTVHKNITGGGWLRLKPGQVTDDTTMSLALGEAIISDYAISAFNIAQAYSDWMKSKPVDIGNTVRRGIMHFRYSDLPFMSKSEMDAGNGACMRSLPIALATYGKDINIVLDASKIQAHITHNNPQSDAGTECIILCVQALLDGADKNDIYNGAIKELLINHPEFDFTTERMNNPTAYIVDTLKVVFQSFFLTDSFESCLIEVVNRGGDADTTGAIAGMLAGALYGTEQIPARWLGKVDSNIISSCKDQALSLIRKSSVIQLVPSLIGI